SRVLARGDRSREERERTPAERERDREERARRRAARSGGGGHVASEPASDGPVEGERPREPPVPDEPIAAPEPPPPELELPEQPHSPIEEPSHLLEPEPAYSPPEEAYRPPEEAEATYIAPRQPEPQEAPEEILEPYPSTGERYVEEHLPVGEQPPMHDEPARALPPVPPPVVLRRSSASGPVMPVTRGRSRRAPLARLAALVALAAAIAAVVLLVKALHGESKVKTPAAPVAIKVLIPEGKTRVQIAQIAAAAGLKGSYRVAARHSSLLDPAHYGAPHGTPDLEGFLFPATYDMDPGDPVSRLVQKQLIAFQENFGVAEIARARALHVTPYDLLIVASMVEREAQVPGDRPKIAAVIYNRLRAGMPLGIDASIYYAVEAEKGVATYTHELTEADLHINSPYNTRTHTGLPPTPISNPGAASIQAAAHPSHVSYLYYVAAADGCGEQVFSTSQATFEANAAAYKAAVSKNGGHPPSCKHK
ncbi:MAG: endolytic transglycosylase MltG, partial [Solirubrobacteraceae bacterium]